MKKKLYVKEGVGFEGITMMHEGTSGLPRMLRVLAVFLITLGVLGFVIAGYLQSQKQSSQKQPQEAAIVLPTSTKDFLSPTPQPTQTTLPTTGFPTAVPSEASLTGLHTVAVLNGSGTKGAAKTMSTALTKAGYTVSRTGNADAFTYQGIIIQTKQSKAQVLSQLKKDLSAQNYLITKSSTDLPETETVDAVVIVGAE